MAEERIVIVEDDAINALSLKMQLESWGYIIATHYAKAEDFLKNIESDSPDLILMDIFLEGEMTGIEAVEILNKKLEIPVIYITASEDPDTLSKMSKTKHFDHIIKPYLYNTLKQKIQKLFQT